MITNKAYEKKIMEKIVELRCAQDFYRREIDSRIDIAEDYGYIVQTYEGMVFVYRPDMTIPDFLQSSIRRCEGVIHGLQLAIDELEKGL